MLDLYAHVLAKVELYDSWAAEHGWLDEDGNPPPFSREYYASLNSAGRLLAKLDEHLRRHQQAGPSPLQSHLPEHYPVDAEFTEVSGDG